jgi:hypothetical protein
MSLDIFVAVQIWTENIAFFFRSRQEVLFETLLLVNATIGRHGKFFDWSIRMREKLSFT